MDDLSIDIVKDNIYYIKSPFKGEIIRFFADIGDSVEKGQTVALFKTNNGYVDIENEYSGVVSDIACGIDETLEKWDDILVVELEEKLADDFLNIATSPDSADYAILYSFQQDILPTLFYGDTEKFIKGFSMDKANFIYFLLSEIYENQDMEIPFSVKSFNVIEQIAYNDIIFIRIDWKYLNTQLLTKSIYVLINSKTKKIQYFTCENGAQNQLVLCSIVPVDGQLTRYNYGPAPSDLELEAGKILEIFLND